MRNTAANGTEQSKRRAALATFGEPENVTTQMSSWLAGDTGTVSKQRFDTEQLTTS